MARTPGSGPRPNASTKINAKTISGTVRQNSRRRRVAKTIERDLTRLADARKQKTNPDIVPARVPTYAISSVSPRSRIQRRSPQNHSERSAQAVDNENFGAMLAK